MSKEIIKKDGKIFVESEYKTGNQAYLAIITGPDPKYKLARRFLNKQRAGLSLDQVEDGTVLEEMIASHSGKNKSKSYFIVRDGELEPISDREVLLIFAV